MIYKGVVAIPVTAPDNLALQESSPAIDAGTMLSVTVTDLLGNERDQTPDIGAFGFTAE